MLIKERKNRVDLREKDFFMLLNFGFIASELKQAITTELKLNCILITSLTNLHPHPSKILKMKKRKTYFLYGKIFEGGKMEKFEKNLRWNERERELLEIEKERTAQSCPVTHSN